MRPRTLLPACLAAALLGALSVAAARHPAVHPILVAADGVLWIETPDWAWSFDAVWRGESLHDLGSDPGRRENVVEAHPRKAALLRGVLLRRMRVRSVTEIPAEASDALQRLKDLGYIGE